MKSDKQEINYKAFFYVGICFLGAGVVFIAASITGVGAAMIGAGVVWMIIGLNKGKLMEDKNKPPRPED
jgi:hypothetical protein